MNTEEDFKNAPVGATATHSDGGRAMKMDYVERRWIVPNGFCLDDEEMERRGYTLDPLPPLPPFPPFPHTTAREALALAWDLAYPVKEGRVIPEGTACLARLDNGYQSYETPGELITSESQIDIRALDPLPDPDPDWLDAPAVIAIAENFSYRRTWLPAEDGYWVSVEDGLTNWTELTDVTPLYPKKDA